MYSERCFHGNFECTRCGFPKDEVDPEIEFALQAEFTRGQKHAERQIASWLREVAETMSHNGDRASGVVEDLADAIERGEWKG
jgi:hypothetical protein